MYLNYGQISLPNFSPSRFSMTTNLKKLAYFLSNTPRESKADILQFCCTNNREEYIQLSCPNSIPIGFYRPTNFKILTIFTESYQNWPLFFSNFIICASLVLIFYSFDILLTVKPLVKYYDPPPTPNGFYWGSTSGLEATLVKIGQKIEVFYVTIYLINLQY